MINYNNLTKEQLTKIIKDLQRQQKYGLIYEKQEEAIVKKCKDHMPILKSIPGRDVNNGEVNHLLVEGDNFASLLALMPVYKGKINCIYIDPNYNTGSKDFVYNDSFVDSEDAFRHSKWLGFMEPRLKLARELLSESGVIFVSIDDNEQANLKLLLDNVFGENNFISNLIWKKKHNGAYDSKFIDNVHEYILLYGKNLNNVKLNKIPTDTKLDTMYKYSDNFVKKRGKYKRVLLHTSSHGYGKTLDFQIKCPDGSVMFPGWNNKTGNGVFRWIWGQEKVNWAIKNDFIDIVEVKGKWNVYYKQYEFVNSENKKIIRGLPIQSIINDVYNNTSAQELKDIFDGNKIFNYAKPSKLLKKLFIIGSNKNSIILDFFAGSGTTGQAVLELNKEDGGKRKFILITNNENSICEKITYERCKRVINGYTTPKGKVVPPTGGNLHYFKTDFIKANQDPAQMRANLKEHIVPLVCIANDTYNNIKTTKGYEVYSNDNLTVAILTRNVPRY